MENAYQYDIIYAVARQENLKGMIKNMNEVFFSDLIRRRHRHWDGCHNIFFKAGTGAGKTYCIVHVILGYLIEILARMLILVPRVTLKEKYQADLFEFAIKTENYNLFEYVHVMTYQELEQRILGNIAIGDFDIFVADECHYFLTDAPFNVNTIVSFNYLMQWLPCKAKIFISATGERIFERIKRELSLAECDGFVITPENYLNPDSFMYQDNFVISHRSYEVYDIPPDYSYVNLKYLCGDENIVDLVSYDVESTWAIFVNSKEIGQEYVKTLTDAGIEATFLCSENLQSNAETVKAITAFENFSQQVLVTTAVIETGVNFRDKNLRNIVIFADTYEQFVQMLGRKRMFRGERVNVFIPRRDAAYFERRYVAAKRELNAALSIWESLSSYRGIMAKVVDDQTEIDIMRHLIAMPNGKPLTNTLYLEEMQHRANFFKEMASMLSADPNAFLREQCRWLKLDFSEERENFVSNCIRQTYIQNVLDKLEEKAEDLNEMSIMEGKALLANLREEAIHVDFSLVKKEVFSIKSFNDFCQKYGLPYQGFSKKVKGDTKYCFCCMDDTCSVGEEKEQC